MQHFPAREAVPRAEMIGAEDLEGRERQVLLDLEGKKFSVPLPTQHLILRFAWT